MGKLVCPRCGYENKENALYCNLCGHIFRYEGKRRKLQRLQTRRSFYDEIERNKRKSYFLMMLFGFLVVVLGYLIGQVWGLGYYGVVIAGVIALIMLLVSYYRGDEVVLALSRAKRVYYEDDPRLFNVVEEMKIAAGLPTLPKIYIIEDTAPNAFATGRDPWHASIAVTRGLLNKLNREELQGVIAHEISHIRNYDIRFAMIAGILLGVVAMISDAFLRSMFYGRRKRKVSVKGQGGVVILVIAILAAILAPIFAKLLQMAISRKREFLADASAVELTRNPRGLANALRKIASDPEPLEVANRATQHLYIVNPVKKIGMKAKSLFSTHPPTEARIRILESMVV
ncbi:MAG: zinc metalloprotease HtpX [Acidobacteria bacterium]|nr:zinc metalloprotease HtpX [Acidobacteriota bacterium]